MMTYSSDRDEVCRITLYLARGEVCRITLYLARGPRLKMRTSEQRDRAPWTLAAPVPHGNAAPVSFSDSCQSRRAAASSCAAGAASTSTGWPLYCFLPLGP
jgi:hypothetical protein